MDSLEKYLKGITITKCSDKNVVLLHSENLKNELVKVEKELHKQKWFFM